LDEGRSFKEDGWLLAAPVTLWSRVKGENAVITAVSIPFIMPFAMAGGALGLAGDILTLPPNVIGHAWQFSH